MRTTNPKPLILLIAMLIFNLSNVVIAQNDKNSLDNPLSQFSTLIGGEWYLEDSYQTFEWGADKTSIQSKSYFVVDGQPKLVSEGFWHWHPAERKIKGYFTAIEMPFVFVETSTSFEEDTMINELKSYSDDGKFVDYVETWEFTGDNSFSWALFQNLPSGPGPEIMSGNYRRK